MSTSTHFKLLNANDPQFLLHKNGNEDEIREWEEDWGSIANNPGAPIYFDDVYKEGDFLEATEDEYSGWIIDLSKLPKETTHIKIERF